MKGFGSIEHRLAPEEPHRYVRALVPGGGIVLTPMADGRTRWAAVTMLDLRGPPVPYWLIRRLAPADGLGGFERVERAALDEAKWPAGVLSSEDGRSHPPLF